MSKEVWKDIKGFEGRYQISNRGQVRSLERKEKNKDGKEYMVKGKIMKQKLSKDGYKEICLRINDKKYYKRVHRLVAEAFIPNPDNLPTVNHINEIKDDNRIENLEWMTIADNNKYGTHIQRCAEGRKRKVRCKETGQVFNSIKEAGEYIGAKKGGNITEHIKGRFKTCGKHPETGQRLTWEYPDEED